MSRAATNYMLVTLALVYMLNFIDRQIFGILLEDIRADLTLEDWQLGLIVGFGFALFYCGFGIPLAVIAERVDRTRFIALALSVWSAMTILCGFAQSGPALFAARIGVGLGEAGGSPPSQSLMSDIFAPEERARALSFWALGSPVGTAIGVVGGAWLASRYGWRVALIAAGMPGLVLALLMRFTLRDPRPPLADRPAIGPALALAAAWSVLRNPALLFAAIGCGIATMVSYCAVLWGPAFYIRVFALSATQVSWFAAIVLGLAAGVGTALGGVIVHRLAVRRPTAYVDVPALGFLLAAPAYWLALYVDDALLSGLLVLVPTVLFALWSGPVFALFQNLTPSGSRAMATAVLFMTVNLIGLGLGPTLVGALSSAFEPRFGAAQGLRMALMVMVAALLPAAGCLFLSRRTLRRTQPDIAIAAATIDGRMLKGTREG